MRQVAPRLSEREIRPDNHVCADIAIIGGGNAALCAALAARSRGCSVLLLERAPREWRGGNSKYTRNLRRAGSAYSPEAFLDDLCQAAGERPIDLDLANLLVSSSAEVILWMEGHGVTWQPALAGTLNLSHTNAFFLGGGKALINHYYQRAAAAGVNTTYDCTVTHLHFDGDRFTHLQADCAGTALTVVAKALVVASGGFGSSREWLALTWGDRAERFAIRGCAFNDGRVVQALLDAGARSAGTFGAFHGTAVDARAPAFDGGIATRVDAIPFGIVVNAHAHRFYDEGEDLWPKRYAIWGRLIAEQPGQAAYAIFDARALTRFIPPLFPPYRGRTARDLAQQLGLDPGDLEDTLTRYNAAVPPDVLARHDRGRLDGCTTYGLSPEKSNWALPLEPPYFAYPLRPGVTFTYYGVAVDGGSRVTTTAGRGFANVFAAGEAMAGNILTSGYLAGAGMTIGTVFGRIAGESAAACV